MGPAKRLMVCVGAVALLAMGCSGDQGPSGSSCTVSDNGDGTKTISCEDGTSVTISDGVDGQNGQDGQDGADGQDGTDGQDGENGQAGTSCSVSDNGDGTKTISCSDGTSVTVSDGADGQDGQIGRDGQDGENGQAGTSCSVSDNGDGTKTISCSDGTSVTVSDGTNGQNGENGQAGTSCSVSDNGDGTKTISCGDGTSVTVSNGADGQNGQDGQPCSVVDNGDGSKTITCPSSDPITVHDGADGNAAGDVVLRLTPEPPGANCHGGGNLIEIGFDSDANGVLSDQEITDFAYACNYLSQPIMVADGTWHSCAILENGGVKCWGGNDFGQLGLGDTDARGDESGEMGDQLPLIDLGADRTATAIAAGDSHSCAILDDATVKCWGANDFGQLGLGDTDSRGTGANQMGDDLPAISLGTDRTATAIAAGDYHTCAILDDHKVKCWGANDFGQLGLGDTNYRGWGPNEMGDDLPAVSLGTDRTATAIAAGQGHNCVILDNGQVKCWGANDSGQLGLGDTTYHGWGSNEMGDDLPAVSLGTDRTATAIAVGVAHSCALLDDGSVKCWGANDSGQLGLGDTDARGTGANQMGDDLPAVNLGTGRTAIAITAGGFHTCAILDDHELKCWGSNDSGQLGLGDTDARGTGAEQMGDDLPAVSLGTDGSAAVIVVGYFHSCAISEHGTLKCWGGNYTGQLGLGDTDARGDATDEMGDALAPVVLLGVP